MWREEHDNFFIKKVYIVMKHLKFLIGIYFFLYKYHFLSSYVIIIRFLIELGNVIKTPSRTKRFVV